MACLDGRLPGHEAHANGAEEYSRAMPAVTLIAADCAGHGGHCPGVLFSAVCVSLVSGQPAVEAGHWLMPGYLR